MKRPNLNKKTEVKVINKERVSYGWRGVVLRLRVNIDNGPYLDPTADNEKIKQAYANGLEPKMAWHVLVRFSGGECWVGAEDVEPIQHKFIDIDYIREKDLDLGILKPDGTKAIRSKNTGAFEPGDLISITTKIDGANASIAWDETAGKLEVFSRTNLLTQPGALRGFYDYIKTKVEPKLDMSKHPNIVVFGEWLVPHSVVYDKEAYGRWYVYDIWNKKLSGYMTQSVVQGFCREYGLEYVEKLYYGPFISWDHCRSFIGKSTAYGPSQEGIVIKNQTKLNVEKPGGPVYIKIVDEKFKEHMDNKGHKVRRPEDPEAAAAKKKAEELMATVITEARVRKLICKFIDEGILPAELTPRDMGTCMKNLPKRLFEDLLKEEPAVVEAAGEYAGKTCAALASKFAKAIIIGK